MTTRVKVITPDNLGKTIVFGVLDPKKLDVIYDQDHFELVEGKGIRLKDSVLKPLKDADIASGDLVGSNLELAKVDGTKIIIPLSNLVPAAKADKFLKGVSYNADTKKLVFSIGNDVDTTTETTEVSVADLLPVVTGNGLQGDGTTANPISIKTPANSGLKVDTNGIAFDKGVLAELVDGDTITVNEQGKLVGAASGLDCEAIAALPRTSWKPDTSVLVNQDGECKRLVPREDIFQEIGVTMSANKLSGLTNQKYIITVTVTNTGLGVNEVTDLAIVKPQLGNYELSDFVQQASIGVNIETTDNLNYKIKGLGAGGSVSITFAALVKSSGNLMFGANVNANTALDLQSNNNQATLVLSVISPVVDNIDVGEDCPLVSVTLDGTPMAVYTSPISSHGEYQSGAVETEATLRPNLKYNLVEQPFTTLKLEGATDIIVKSSTRVVHTGSFDGNYPAYADLDKGVIFLGDASLETHFIVLPDSKTDIANSVPYTFENGTLTFAEPVKFAKIFMRKGSNKCKWQTVLIVAKTDIPSKFTLDTTATNFVKQFKYDKQVQTSELAVASLKKAIAPEGYTLSVIPSRVEREEFITVTIPKGVESSFTVTASKNGILSNIKVSGRINASSDANGKVVTVNTVADIKPEDSITLGKYIKVEVV
jgi:hypothetical protein|nr:MAG TPA: hypothetical protein [Caudoviricetes sp.]